MSFKDYAKKNGLASASNDDLRNELNHREASGNRFPLEVFHPKIKPFLNFMVEKFDVPADYVGICLLSAYSSAIGTAYAIETNLGRIYLPVWACMAGMSSSGKSVAMDYIYKPLTDIQNEFDQEWEETTANMTDEKKQYQNMRQVILRDIHIATLMRHVMPDNPKGLMKYHDELLEWINSMNAMSRGKEGTDEQFWLSSWNCRAYSPIRSGKQKFNNPRPFVNVLGGIQRKILPKLFANDRDSTGFVFRILFTNYIDTVADIDADALMPDEFQQIHNKSLEVLYHSLPVESAFDDPKKCIVLREAGKVLKEWIRENNSRINHIQEAIERETESGIFGKVKEYAQRFAAILAISDRALSIETYYGWNNHMTAFPIELHVTQDHIERGILLADYFRKSASTIYDMVSKNIVAPYDVLEAAVLFNKGMSYTDMARHLLKDNSEASRQKMAYMCRKWMKEYPKVFKAENR